MVDVPSREYRAESVVAVPHNSRHMTSCGCKIYVFVCVCVAMIHAMFGLYMIYERLSILASFNHFLSLPSFPCTYT